MAAEFCPECWKASKGNAMEETDRCVVAFVERQDMALRMSFVQRQVDALARPAGAR